MMKTYTAVTALLSVAAAILLPDRLRVNAGSLLPLVLMFLSAAQAYYFHRHRKRTDFNSSGGASPLTEEEWGHLSLYVSRSFSMVIPLYLPFILFFPLWGKVMSLILYLAAFAGGNILFRIRHGRVIRERLRREEEEIRRQISREELGRWK